MGNQPVKISSLQAVDMLESTDIFPISRGDKSYQGNVDQLTVLLGGTQTLTFNPTSRVLSISGANSVTIPGEVGPTHSGAGPTYILALPSGAMLTAFAIRSDTNGVYSVSLDPSARDQIDSNPLAANVWAPQALVIFGGDSGVNITFKDLTGNLDFKFFIQK